MSPDALIIDNIAHNISRIKADISEAALSCGRSVSDIRIMAVTKTIPPEYINAALSSGIDLIGENRTDELLKKYDAVDRSKAEIHFIGNLQTNKVKHVVGKTSLIHSVDSLRLARFIDAESNKRGITTEILVEINIGGQLTKNGISPLETEDFMRSLSEFRNIKVRGLMAIPPPVSKGDENEKFFRKMFDISVDIKGKNIDNISMDILSMGMSADYISAVKCGSTLIRLGTAIFGKRIYT